MKKYALMKRNWVSLLVVLVQYQLIMSTSNSLIIPRSQSVDAARELVGWQNLINRCNEDCFYGAFSFTAEYEQNFRGAQLARCMFGQDVTPTVSGMFCAESCNNDAYAMLTISGSQAATRGANDWLADYFGLGTNFRSVVTFAPRIQNAIFDFNFYVGLDEWAQGLFFRMHFPIVWTKWSLRATEYVVTPGTNPDYVGYMNSAINSTGSGLLVGIPSGNLPQTFLSAVSGLNGTFGDVTQDFQFGIIGGLIGTGSSMLDRCGTTKSGVSDIELAFGWNFLCCDDYHLGLELRSSVPTGNKPGGRFLFEPIVGNGRYATLGVGATSHYIVWQDCDENKALGLWLDLNVTHLFSNCQLRSFDFKNKPNSRYALLETLQAPAINLRSSATAGSTAPGQIPATQYVGTAGGLVHAINATTFAIGSSFGAQADLALKLGYHSCHWEIDIGYNLWARSREKICSKGPGLPANMYALKGDAYVYGYTSGSAAVPLSATESLSDIHTGTNTPLGTTFATAQLFNPTVDSAQFAQTNAGALVLGPDIATQTETSSSPVILSDNDINYCGVPAVVTNRLFTNFNYTCVSHGSWTPFLGIGASGEFAGRCCAISQWAVWLKTGVAYN